MQALIQRVKSASVEVDNTLVASINTGILAYIAVNKFDDLKKVQKLADKIANYRIFSDQNNKMNLSLKDLNGELLVISQFTLGADTKKGLRPSFSDLMAPSEANIIFQEIINYLSKNYKFKVASGIFQADMQIASINDGPVNFLLSV